jgi:hypothetical protein
VAVLAATGLLALIIARSLRPLRATRLRGETTLVLSRRAALRRRVRMTTVRARARRGTISIRRLLRVQRLRGLRVLRAGVTVVRRPIVRRHGSLVRRVHLVRPARPHRVRVVHHNGRLRLRHSGMRVHHLRARKARHLPGAKVLLRRAAKVHHRNGRMLRSILRVKGGENQWIVCSGRRLGLSCWPVFFMAWRC